MTQLLHLQRFIYFALTALCCFSSPVPEQQCQNAILTVGRQYTAEPISPFVLSWYRHIDNSTLFYFTEVRQNTKTYFEEKFPIIVQTGRFVIVDIDYKRFNYVLNHNRFFLYQDFMRSRQEEFCYVLMADVRDVVFQSNPFTNIYYRSTTTPQQRSVITPTTRLQLPPVIFSVEERHFGNNPIHNDKWIKKIFGTEGIVYSEHK